MTDEWLLPVAVADLLMMTAVACVLRTCRQAGPLACRREAGTRQCKAMGWASVSSSSGVMMQAGRGVPSSCADTGWVLDRCGAVWRGRGLLRDLLGGMARGTCGIIIVVITGE